MAVSTTTPPSPGRGLTVRAEIARQYDDVLTPAVWLALEALAPLDLDRKRLMRERIERRAARARGDGNGRHTQVATQGARIHFDAFSFCFIH